MSELHPTPSEIEAMLSPDARARLAEIEAWTEVEYKRRKGSRHFVRRLEVD